MKAIEPTLRPRQLNRALLARQLLLARSNLPLPRALERIAGLQTQYAPSAYIGLWSRLRDFRRGDLTRALERQRVIQGTLMRATIHMVSARDYPLFAEAIRDERRAWWLRTQRKALAGVDMNGIARRMRAMLARGPLRQAEIAERLSAAGLPRIAWVSAGMWLDLVRVPPSGTWEERRADLYGLAPESKARPHAPLVHLVKRYLGGFGPATLDDLASWSGLPARTLRPVIERLHLARFGELYDLPGAPLPDEDTPAPVRFLPTWDAALLVHARRSQILPERYRPLVFNTKTPHSVSTFLVDGAVAGRWWYDKERVRLEPFGRLSRTSRRALDEEAERLAAFHAD